MAPDAASAEVGSQELLQVEVLAVLVVVVFLVGQRPIQPVARASLLVFIEQGQRLDVQIVAADGGEQLGELIDGLDQRNRHVAFLG